MKELESEKVVLNDRSNCLLPQMWLSGCLWYFKKMPRSCGTIGWMNTWVEVLFKVSLSIKQLRLTEALGCGAILPRFVIPAAASTYVCLCTGFIPDINAALGGCDDTHLWAIPILNNDISFRCLEQPPSARLHFKYAQSHMWIRSLVVPTTSALQSLRKEAHYFKDNLGYTVRP